MKIELSTHEGSIGHFHFFIDSGELFVKYRDNKIEVSCKYDLNKFNVGKKGNGNIVIETKINENS